MTIIIFDGFSLQLKSQTPLFLLFSIVTEVIEQLDRSVMAIRGATRNSMKYVSTRETHNVATPKTVHICIPYKPDFEQETYLHLCQSNSS